MSDTGKFGDMVIKGTPTMEQRVKTLEKLSLQQRVETLENNVEILTAFIEKNQARIEALEETHKNCREMVAVLEVRLNAVESMTRKANTLIGPIKRR